MVNFMKQEQFNLEEGYDAIAFKKKLDKYTKKALADQKNKIREWLLINCKKDGFCILNKEGLKKFEELAK